MSFHTKKYIQVNAQLISENETHWRLDVLEAIDGIMEFSKEEYNYNYEEELLEAPIHLLEEILDEQFI